ncbi:hypothetical protein FRB94_009993 [Tulasnella sp. JGI-2019a]|nr:hypothetical protein FRB93_011082 [Tulasnella sp. JGI-2019a]KAG9010717.1 hypothetical protein FRB94_009993 [Tulasnella sp. JGI-2019a]KAG9028605.1 hypothetical protein FRB95_006283 [Tulasnella sp. JGI-2019a]
MAHPSSSHRDRDDDRGTVRERERERDRERRTATVHHHRTISSTTLLLVLSLILAVLAVMLSLPSRSSGVLSTSRAGQQPPTADPNMNDPEGGPSHSFWGYLTPKRSHALVSRESNVALREAEVARREAELLVAPPAFEVSCPVCEPVIQEVYQEPPQSIALVQRPAPPAPPPPATTVIKEIIKEVEPSDPTWLKTRLDGLVERETKISDREKEVGQREENVGKRESDATKREGWIMEQLNALAAPDPREQQQSRVDRVDRVEEEYIYEKYEDNRHYEDQPRHYYGEARRVAPKLQEIPAPTSTSTVLVTATETITQVVPPPPAGTRLAAHPTPETFIKGATGSGAGRTMEIFVEEPQETVTVYEPMHRDRGREREREQSPRNWW